MYSLKNFIDSHKDVMGINDVLSVRYEIARTLKKYQERTLKFNKIKEYPGKYVVGNLINSRDIIKYILNAKSDVEVYSKIINACEHPLKPREANDATFLYEKYDDLKNIPILLHYERDGGPYITSSVVIAKDPETGIQNASIHRLMMIDEKHLTIRIVPRHLYRIYKKSKDRGEDLNVAIAIGLHPIILIAAATSPPYGVDEIYVANKLSDNNIDVFYLENSELFVPTSAEIIIEGRVLKDKLANEGPFVDITGTYDIVRRQPIIEVKNVFMAETPYYHAILPAGIEHRLLMGLYREAIIWRRVSEVVPHVKAVRLTTGGCGWLHCIISIKKNNDGDPKNAILTAFSAHPSLKMVIAVDEDIDVDDPNDVEWAIATRFQADEDLIIIRNCRGSSIDPSADQHNLLTSKMGIDATIPFKKDITNFIKAKIP